MEINITDILVEDNPRTDFAKLEELAASMKAKGLITPIVVEPTDDGKFKLVVGERRLRAAKSLNWPTIRATKKTCDGNELEIHLIENIQRQDLNPVEEGLAMKKVMKKKKLSAKQVAQDIGKTELFVERRLELLKASDNVQKAIRDGKIKLGHGVALSQVSEKKKQDKILKEIIRDKLTVDSTCRSIRSASRRLEDAQFGTDKCKGCRFNGGEQTLLDESEGSLKNLCLDRGCFDQRNQLWLEAEKKELKERGVKIVTGEAANRLYRKKVYRNDKGAAEKDMVKHPEDYAVQLEKDWQGNYEKEIYRLKPEKKAGATKGPTNPKVAAAQLENKIADYQRQFLIRKNKEKQVPDSKISKALTAYFMIEEAGWSSSKDILKDMGIKSDGYGIDSEKLLRKVLASDEGVLDEVINKQNQIRIKGLGTYDNTLLILSRATKINMKKEFQVNESYLNLYTIAQLPVIAKELGVTVSKGKKTDMIKEILKQDLRGKVPKAMMLK